MISTLKNLELKRKVLKLKSRSMDKNLSYITKNFDEIV